MNAIYFYVLCSLTIPGIDSSPSNVLEVTFDELKVTFLEKTLDFTSEKLPESTEEVKKLIDQLGSDQYVTRENSARKLKEMGWNALKGLLEAEYHEDLEVKLQSKRIFESYFIVHPKTTSIWYLPNELRFPKGYGNLETSDFYSVCTIIEEPDIALKYFEKAENLMTNPIETWTNEYVSVVATSLFIQDLILSGKTREEAKKLLKTMENLEETHAHYHQSESLDAFYDIEEENWDVYPPGPMILKEKYLDPIEYDAY